MPRPPRSDLVSDGAPAARLNEHQARRIQTMPWYVDDLAKGTEALTQPDPSPFVRERPDLSQDEARLLLSFVSLARKRMVVRVAGLGPIRREPRMPVGRRMTSC